MTEKTPENIKTPEDLNTPFDMNQDLDTKAIQDLGKLVAEQEEQTVPPNSEEFNDPEDDEKLKKAQKNQSIIGNTTKAIGMGAMMASSVSGMASTNEAPKNADLFPDAIETSYEAKEENTEDLADPFNVLPGSETEPEVDPIKKAMEKKSAEVEETKSETSIENFEFFEKVMDAGFDMGKADVPPEKVEEIKNEFSNFLESLPNEIKEKINKGELEIVIEGSASSHPIAETGVDTGAHGKAFTNKQLAEFRSDEGVKIMKMALENSPSIMKAEILASIPPDGVYQGNANEVLEEGRFVKISIKDAIESNADKNSSENMSLANLESLEILKDLPLGTLEKMYIDGSASMKNKASKLFSTLEKGGYIDGAVSLQFGAGAGEISETKKVISARDVELFDGSIQAQEKFSDKEETFRNAQELLRNMPMVKYEDRNENSQKIISLLTDEYLKISAEEISQLESQEEARDAKLVFFMENRDSGEVTALTLEKIKELYESQVKGGEMLTLDVNEKKIEDKRSVDILVK